MSTPVVLLQSRKFLLHPLGGPSLDFAHQIAHRQFLRDRDEHFDMVAGKNVLDDINTVFSADLANDIPKSKPNIPEQQFVAVLCSTHQMIAMLENAMLAFIVENGH
jgi:hypothetical protein